MADDDPGIRNYLCQFLEQEGYRVAAATNGRRALDLARKQPPDLITMDLRMPEMGGDTAIDHLRLTPELKHIPVIVISEVPAGKRTVGDAFIDKPIDEDQLLATIERLLTPRRADPAQRPCQAPLVMVVDDDPSIRSYLSQVMENEGYRVAAAETGRQALSLAHERRPDLITMDLRMPDIDGRTAISSLRADPALSGIPIIVISVLPERDQAGGDIALEKPVEEEHLLASARLLLQRDGVAQDAHSSSAQSYLIIDLPGAKTSLPAMPVGEAGIVRCAMADVACHLDAGFAGMLVVPAEALTDLDLQHIFDSSRVLGVIIDGSRSADLPSGS